ncbi:hypothetical protein PR202_ga23457 [Eleusine coracana subsp. coracana]|uniref:Pentatricopeptide repeat-containing protein n=1 Tax=Eleusine coracana subsp. coracana TaxID=191504 RepID=A0AAV5D594_ELECO|nr:hypothetical protein PR202_ga23457 [Eleusine coracana subsp. coracana]
MPAGRQTDVPTGGQRRASRRDAGPVRARPVQTAVPVPPAQTNAKLRRARDTSTAVVATVRHSGVVEQTAGGAGRRTAREGRGWVGGLLVSSPLRGFLWTAPPCPSSMVMLNSAMLPRQFSMQNDEDLILRSFKKQRSNWQGSLRDATKEFGMRSIASKLRPDLITYGTYINVLTKNGRTGAAVKLFNSMREKGTNPDVAICNCIIDHLCFKKKIPEALEIFGEMNDQHCQADVATYNTLIKHLCKIRRMEKVYELLDEMEAKGCTPNNRTYSYILKMAEKPKDVITLMQRMEESGCKPDSDTYNLLLNLFVNWEYEKGVQQVWEEMEGSGSGPDQRSFTIMVHGLHSQGKLDEALQYYNTMQSRGMIPEPRTKILVKAMYMKKDMPSIEDQPPTMRGKNLKLDPRSRLFHVHK